MNFAVGTQLRPAENWLLSLGFAYDESIVSVANRTPDLPVDRQLRYAAGVQYDISEKLTLGAAYEYLDAGSAKIDQNRGPLAGRLQGDYSSNELHFFNVNLIWRM